MTRRYVIYCRKSTDETSKKQQQSIPDQIRACISFAYDNGLRLLERPKDFSEFETERDVAGRLSEDAEIYDRAKPFFVVTEQKSAKQPRQRPRWNAIVRLIEAGKIDGLISYSPDRQSRNLVDGGELIHLANSGKVDLRYPQFHYENNAAGNMMLGVWFVLSKQYADKLSEDSKRGSRSRHQAGKTLGYKKY